MEHSLTRADWIGSGRVNPLYPTGWAQMSNTPFPSYKTQTGAGGRRVACIVSWPEKIKEHDEDRKAGPRDFKILKYSSRGGQRPEVKTVRVLGNQRLAAGGQIKRAKPKQKSVKKGRHD